MMNFRFWSKMKIFLFILIIIVSNFAISCGDVETTTENIDKCENFNCYNNSSCKVIDDNATCICNNGYEFSPSQHSCVKKEISLCDINPCTEEHKTICSIVETGETAHAECSCDADFILNEEDKCVCKTGYILENNSCKKIPENKPIKIRFTSANLTSGNNQAYEEEGIRILKALKSDIIMIQEFNFGSNTKNDIKNFVKNTFGTEYQYFRGTPTGNGDIPNGIISKYPIIKTGEITDPRVTDRKIDYVEIKVNDKINLMVFSVHLKGQEDDSQITAAQLITQKISEHKKTHTGYYYIVGGDFNGEASVGNEGFGKFNNKEIMQINFPYPKSEYGNDGNTNRTRTAKLDFILADTNLYQYQISTDYCISNLNCKKYENGLVFDSRNYSRNDLDTYFTEVQPNDCDAKNMQHLAVVKDFLITKEQEVKKAVLTEEEFNSIFKNPIATNKSTACPGYNFYNYTDFINATKEYPLFGNEGTEEIKKREIAAFLANISHETTGGWSGAPGGENGRYLWGLCWIDEIGCEDGSCTQYCQENNETYPCANGKTYHGRGPIQLTWNYNYGAMGEHIGVDLLNHPEIVSTNATISFKTALWFWMTPQSPKPSAHDVMIGHWTPNSDDLDKNRLSGFGMTVNIINGGAECGKINDSRVNDRVNHFKYFCELLNTTTEDNLYCDQMQHYKK